MIMITKMKTEATAVINCYDSRRKYDTYYRKLLSNKQILAYVMKGCILKYADIPLKSIPSYIKMSFIDTAGYEYINDHQVKITDETIPGTQIEYNIQFEVAIPMKHRKAGRSTPTDKEIRMIINLGSQTKDDPDYPLIKRALYYYSRLMTRQKYFKDGFRCSGYDRIKKICSIWVCIDHSNQRNDIINTYKIQETRETEIWHAAREGYDLFTAVMVYPKKEDIRKAQNIPNAIEQGDENK